MSAVDRAFEDDRRVIEFLAGVVATYGKRLQAAERALGQSGEGYFTNAKDAIRVAEYNTRRPFEDGGPRP